MDDPLLYAVITCFVSMVIFSGCSGFWDAVLYSKTGADSFHWDEHIIWLCIRVSAGLSILSSYWMALITGNIWPVFGVLLAFFLVFSFFHNEVYYWTRAKIAQKKYIFGYQSSTSSAKFEMNVYIRTLGLILGLGILIGGYILLR